MRNWPQARLDRSWCHARSPRLCPLHRGPAPESLIPASSCTYITPTAPHALQGSLPPVQPSPPLTPLPPRCHYKPSPPATYYPGSRDGAATPLPHGRPVPLARPRAAGPDGQRPGRPSEPQPVCQW